MKQNKKTQRKAKQAAKAQAEPKAAPKGGATPEQIAAAHAEVVRRVPLTRPCGCGCGAEAKGRFLPGHDARLFSAILKELVAA